MQGQHDGSSERNIFEGLFTEEVMRSGKAIFVVFKFLASEASNKFDSTASAVHIEEDRSAYMYTQEYQKH